MISRGGNAGAPRRWAAVALSDGLVLLAGGYGPHSHGGPGLRPAAVATAVRFVPAP